MGYQNQRPKLFKDAKYLLNYYMLDAHYTDARLAALYDYDSGWSPDRTFYLDLADQPRLKILDVGCGTGLLSRAYAARGHDVTGVDPPRGYA